MSTFLWTLVVVAAPVLAVLWVLGRNTGKLGCGCPARGAVYGCMTCGYTRCPEHRYDAHDCNEVLREAGDG